MKKLILVLGFILTVSLNANAAVILTVGDDDGFGFTSTAGLVNSLGNPADYDGDGKLGIGDVLPNLRHAQDSNQNPAVNWADFFDNRDGSESADTTGSEWTDVGLIGTGTAIKELPSGTQITNSSPGQAKNASFDFTFNTADVAGETHYFSLIYGDFDADTVALKWRNATGTTGNNLTVQGLGDVPKAGTGNATDGMIGRLYAELPALSMSTGFLRITVDSGLNEPFTAFDYAMLDIQPIQLPSDFEPIPEPGTFLLFGSGVLALVGMRRRVNG